jgi:hypothetical protein
MSRRPARVDRRSLISDPGRELLGLHDATDIELAAPNTTNNNTGDDSRVVHLSNPQRNAQFGDNRICNTKYTLLSFLPKNFAEQFSLNMNRYFLLIAVLQLNRTITPVSPVTTWAPLLILFGISAVKEASDDLWRHRADRRANERPVRVLRPSSASLSSSSSVYAEAQAQSLCVGDIVVLQRDDEIPADMCLLKCVERRPALSAHTVTSPTCYIETGRHTAKGRSYMLSLNSTITLIYNALIRKGEPTTTMETTLHRRTFCLSLPPVS